jgi:hypothetical protein
MEFLENIPGPKSEQSFFMFLDALNQALVINGDPDKVIELWV